MAREALERLAQRRELVAPLAHGARDVLGERARKRGHRPDGTGLDSTADERLRADEHLEALVQERLERLVRGVRHLHADEVRRLLPQAGEHRRRDGVAARARELVYVE